MCYTTHTQIQVTYSGGCLSRMLSPYVYTYKQNACAWVNPCGTMYMSRTCVTNLRNRVCRYIVDTLCQGGNSLRYTFQLCLICIS